MQVTEFFCSPIAVFWSALLQMYSWLMAVQWGGRARPLCLWPFAAPWHPSLNAQHLQHGIWPELHGLLLLADNRTLQANNWITRDTLVEMEIEISEGRTPQNLQNITTEVDKYWTTKGLEYSKEQVASLNSKERNHKYPKGKLSPKQISLISSWALPHPSPNPNKSVWALCSTVSRSRF